MARAPQSRQHPWLSELVGGPPSRHCPREPVVTLPALGAAHQPAACCAHRRASQRRRTPRQRRGKTFASVALLQHEVAIQHEAANAPASKRTFPAHRAWWTRTWWTRSPRLLAVARVGSYSAAHTSQEPATPGMSHATANQRGTPRPPLARSDFCEFKEETRNVSSPGPHKSTVSLLVRGRAVRASSEGDFGERTCGR